LLYIACVVLLWSPEDGHKGEEEEERKLWTKKGETRMKEKKNCKDKRGKNGSVRKCQKVKKKKHS